MMVDKFKCLKCGWTGTEFDVKWNETVVVEVVTGGKRQRLIKRVPVCPKCGAVLTYVGQDSDRVPILSENGGEW